jgi:hypothetical protein
VVVRLVPQRVATAPLEVRRLAVEAVGQVTQLLAVSVVLAVRQAAEAAEVAVPTATTTVVMVA